MPFRSVKPYASLCRVYIALFAACSAGTGYFLSSYRRPLGGLFSAGAVFLLACGASALNQYQERDIDGKMERTRRRPLPAGSLAPARALTLSLTLIGSGLALLSLTGKGTAVFLACFAIVWYNAVYTPLKRVTAFAAVPGAAVGMVPPAIGWVAAGGTLLDPRLFAVSFLFFMWQVPHFWLLVLRHGEEYERAGLPSLTRKLARPQIARVTFGWIVASAVASLALPLYRTSGTAFTYWLFIPPAVWLIWSERALAGHGSFFSPPLLFRKINIYLFVMMTLLALQGIWYHGQ